MIECIWFDKAPEDGKGWSPGWCFPAIYEYDLSKHYQQNVRSIRPPIMVCLPIRNGNPDHGTQFIVDGHPTGDPEGKWEVVLVGWPFKAGVKPDITVSPSINAVGIYHGFLTNGVLTDDLDG